MPNFAYLFGVGRDGDEVPGNGLFIVQRFQRPRAGRVGIGHRFEGREGLRRDDEKRLFGVEVACRLFEVRAVHVRDETEGHVALAVVLQRLVSHDGTKIGAADADVDDVADALSGVSPPLAAANLLRENGHPVKYCVHLGHDIDAVDENLFALRGAQGDVKNGPILRDVDLLAAGTWPRCADAVRTPRRDSREARSSRR